MVNIGWTTWSNETKVLPVGGVARRHQISALRSNLAMELRSCFIWHNKWGDGHNMTWKLLEAVFMGYHINDKGPFLGGVIVDVG